MNVIVALRNLEMKGSSEKVREKAAGALWVIEDRAKQIKETPTKPGLYHVTFIHKLLEISVVQ